MLILSGVELDDEKATLPFELMGYIELMDSISRIAWRDKRSFMPENTSKMLSALRLAEHQRRMLALRIQKEAIVMFNDLDMLAARGRNEAIKAA